MLKLLNKLNLTGNIKYRAAGAVMLLLIIIGTILLKNVREHAEVEVI